MQQSLKKIFPDFLSGLLNSYTQVFFSNNRIFAVILIIVTFFDRNAGFSGLLAVIISNGIASLIGFNRFNIKSGYYGFNSLLVGLGLGIYYQMHVEFLLILLFASIFTLFFTVVMEGVIGKYGLPYLSISFLFGIWMVTLASREFTALSISERGMFVTNELFGIGGYLLVNFYDWFSHIRLHESIVIYFRSLGAIFFQYHLFAGIIIAIGVLIYSRQAFLLSLVGFFSAYLFYKFVGGNIYELSYSYIGFNFILTSIAIGGFFIIPSRYSFLWVILLTPLISITITSSIAVLNLFQLSIYSLPFNVVVLLFLYILKFRDRSYDKPEIVVYQQFSPEKNLYAHLNNQRRFSQFKFIPVALPFWGEWTVTQAHHGKFTHREDWAHAWDFEITDDNGSNFKKSGNSKEDYYCYNKPVICPADGWVEEIADGIDDNEIGDSNLEQNWGNTIIVRHSEKLYSKLSHLKKETFKVKKGDFVKRGDVLAHCGNSGRSPEPHLHFQLQETPFIGSKTLDYPIAHYILRNEDDFEFKTYGRPEKEDVISNIEKNPNLHGAFHFVPGQMIHFRVNDSDQNQWTVSWEVRTDIYNNPFLFCKRTKSKAWLKNEGNLFYFTHFEGNKNSLLFYFYVGAYKISLGFYKGLKITDTFPIHLLNSKGLIFIQDFIAPFYIFLKTEFTLEFIKLRDDLTDSHIHFISNASVKNGNKVTKELNFEFEVESKRIKRFVCIYGNRSIEAHEVSNPESDEAEQL
ncbi:MAG: urea transporter [Bacteroidales bacterium]|nr:urea transporter [Bacteroidales bacterium]